MNKIINKINKANFAIKEKTKNFMYSIDEIDKIMKSNGKIILATKGITSIDIFRNMYRPGCYDDVKLTKSQIKMNDDYRSAFRLVNNILK